jgi:phage terminase large subunit-like protein
LDPVALALDVTPDRRFTAVAVAGYRADGLAHGEVIAHEPGTAWVVDYVVDRLARHEVSGVVVDPASPAGSLILDLENAGVTVTQTSPRDMAQACGSLYDAVSEGSFRHIDQPVLNAAVGSAESRPLADAWAWQRKSKGDISPLVAVTLALSAARRPPEQSAPVFAY